jgi:hypothetical protein
MSDGTPLDALETGDIQNAADAEKMQAILSDINASGADIATQYQAPPTHSAQPMPPMQPMPMQPMQPMPPMQHMAPPQYQQHYVPVDEEEPVYKPKKKTNVWSSILGRICDPIVVAVIVFAVSLPVLHTFVGKYASWAFAVGGQLSWFGLIALSLFAGTLFGLYRASCDILGL